MASKYDFGGPGVTKPHPKKNWVNPDAKQVHWASGEGPRRGTGPSGPSRERSGKSPVRLLVGLLGLIVLVVVIAVVLFAFVL